MLLNALEIKNRLNQIFYAAHADKIATPPEHQSLQQEQSLQAVFQSCAEADTTRIGEAVAEFFISSAKNPSILKRFRLGLFGGSGCGKSTFSEGLLVHLDKKIGLERITRTDITTAFNVQGIGIVTHHDAGHRYKDPLSLKYADQPGLEIIEHPHFVDNPYFDFLIHFDADSKGRILTFLANDDISQSERFPPLLSKLADYKIR